MVTARRPLIDGTIPNPVQQIPRVQRQPVLPAVDNVWAVGQRERLAQDQVAMARAYYDAILGIGQGEVALGQEDIQFNREMGLREIERQSGDARDAVRNNALQRGIFESGIRVEGEQDVLEARTEAEAMLEHNVASALAQLQLRLAELTAQWGFNLGQAGVEAAQGSLGFVEDIINAGGSFVSGTTSGSGNLNAQNIAAARAGVGAYGQRVQIAAQYGRMLADKYGLQPSGINYFRPASESSGGGRSRTSDHITAGAVDFYINPATQFEKGVAMIQELNQLMSQGIVSGYIWHPDRPGDPHYGHIHVSFALPGGGSADTVGEHVSGTYAPPASGGGSSGTGGSGGGGTYYT